MAKKIITDLAGELQDILAQKLLVLGTEHTLKDIKKNKLGKIYITSNAPEQVKQDIKRYAMLASVEVQDITQTNEELGVMCKKPFSISVVGVLKE